MEFCVMIPPAGSLSADWACCNGLHMLLVKIAALREVLEIDWGESILIPSHLERAAASTSGVSPYR